MLLDAADFRTASEPRRYGAALRRTPSDATAAEIGVRDGDPVTVGSGHGDITLAGDHRHARSRGVAAAELAWFDRRATLRVSVGAVVDIRGGDRA
jgi:hypothetical protein